MSSRIIATAAKAPDQVITNDDLAKIVDTSDEWIVQRTGIRSRHISNGENTSVSGYLFYTMRFNLVI